MKIVIKEMLSDADYYDNLNFVGKQIFDFKFDFVYERLAVLRDEIDKEEQDNLNAKIRLVMEGDTVNDFIEVKGYSDQLIIKIRGCFSGQDAIYFESRIYQLTGANRGN